MEVASADQSRDAQSALADQVAQERADLRLAMQQTGWTVDALAAAMSEALGRTIDRGYCWRLVNNEKPWRDEYTVALPDDLEGKWKAIGAERRGYIVATRPTSREQAARDLVSGLLGLALLPAAEKKVGAA